MINVSGAFTVDLAVEQLMDVVYKNFAFVCFDFHGAAPNGERIFTVVNTVKNS